MSLRRSGFTLVELLVVSVLTAVAIAGIYQTLTVQGKSYGAAGLMVHDLESVRTALGILESELREVGAVGGAAIGGSDIAVASPDSVTFRAQRKTGFVCKLARNERWAITWTPGEPFEEGDSVHLFVDGDPARFQDDRWDTTIVTGARSAADADCTSSWDIPLQHLELEAHDLAGVQAGSPIRSFEWTTYALYPFEGAGWGLGRRRREDRRPTYLTGGLAGPGRGLQIDYFTAAGTSTNDPSQIARIRITIRTDPPGGSGVDATEMATNLFLRNN